MNLERPHVKGMPSTGYAGSGTDLISPADTPKIKDGNFFIAAWLRDRNSLELPGIWELAHNLNFDCGGFVVTASQTGEAKP